MSMVARTEPGPAEDDITDTDDGDTRSSAGAFWPDIVLRELRLAVRLPGRVTTSRLLHTATGAVAHVTRELEAWQQEQQAAGHQTLADVPAPVINGESVNLWHWRNAVYTATRALILERYRDADTTDKGDRRADALDIQTSDLWRDVSWAKKEAERAEKAKQRGEKAAKKKAVGSQFFNNLAGLLGDEFMKRGATLHGCDVKTRDAFANMDIAGYNYGIYRYKHDLKKYPQRLILGSETFCNDAYKFRELAKQEPRLVGDFVWAGMDYLGEVMVGSWEYADYAETFDGGPGWVSAGSGRIDLTGKPLGEALYTRVALEADNGPYIAVCPVNHTGDRHSPSAWKMTNAMPSWSWTGCEGRKANVEVYARAARVELVLNGHTVGSKTLKNDCLARFSIPYESGTLEAVSYDAADHEIGRCKLQSAGGTTRLTLDAEEPTVKPGHLCYIRLRYTDENGITKPLARGSIQVQVRGGTFLRLSRACPFNKHSYLDSETDTYYGEALAIVRMGDGDAMTIAASDGEYSAELTVPAQA